METQYFGMDGFNRNSTLCYSTAEAAYNTISDCNGNTMKVLPVNDLQTYDNIIAEGKIKGENVLLFGKKLTEQFRRLQDKVESLESVMKTMKYSVSTFDYSLNHLKRTDLNLVFER